MTHHLAVLEVLVIHDRMIEEFGSASGVRDAGALEAALYRPVTGYYDDVIAQAAALLESLLVIHPFVDGHERTAFAVADIFLRLNGFLVATSTDDAYDVIIETLTSGGDRFDRFDAWLRGHVGELP